MTAPTTAAGRAGLAALRSAPAGAVLALDYDGTLAPIVARPEQASPAPGATAALAVLAPRVRTLALVTGRAAAALVDLAGLRAVPGLLVLGQYGVERWDGALVAEPAAPGLPAVRRALEDLPSGLRLEDKGRSLVVHARGLPDPVAALAAIEPRLRELAAQHALAVHPGRLVLEVRPAGADKGRALLALCEPRPSAVLYVGDDLGDLPALDAVAALRREGVPGLAVCSDSDEAPAALRARADLVVDGPAGVVALLESLLTL